jgi:hypothetical protein
MRLTEPSGDVHDDAVKLAVTLLLGRDESLWGLCACPGLAFRY